MALTLHVAWNSGGSVPLRDQLQSFINVDTHDLSRAWPKAKGRDVQVTIRPTKVMAAVKVKPEAIVSSIPEAVTRKTAPVPYCAPGQ